MILFIVVVLVLLVSILILRAFLVLSDIRKSNAAVTIDYGKNDDGGKRRTAPISTVVVLGSGGHTTEMLQLLQSLNHKQYTPLTFIVAKTDTTSLRRVAARQEQDRITADHIYHIPRSREVGQSYLTSIATTLWSLIYTLGLVIKIRPGLLLCNGPGTCLPIAVWTFVGRLLGLWEGKIVFCESFCRVTSLSLTGKLLYPIVDLFVVHWEQLQALYPKSHLVTTFVPRSSSAEEATTTKKNTT